MNWAPSGVAANLLADLTRRGLSAELFEKRGRSRQFVRLGERSEVPVRAGLAVAQEAGWALRAGDRRRSLFLAATGPLPETLELPEPSPHPVRLPEGARSEAIAAGLDAPWQEAPGTDAPLMTEAAASTLFATLERELRRELPASRLVAARLEDGAAESAIVATAGIRASWRARIGWLRLEVEALGRRCSFEGTERSAAAFDARRIAVRLADRLSALAEGGGAAEIAPGSAVVLAAPLAARLLQAVAPAFLGPAAAARLAALGALSPELTIVDDGRLESGVLAAPVDGEGLPTGRTALVEDGRFVRPLLAWWESGAEVLPGCARRASWRDLPRRAPTHLYLAPGEVDSRDLQAADEPAALLLDAEGPVRFDPVSLSWEVLVSGLRLEVGRAVAPLGALRLAGDLRTLLAGVRHRGRDLEFVPGDGMFGSPSLVVSGLRLVRESAAI